MAVAAVADEVDDDIGIKFGAIFGSEAANAHGGIGIFGVDVEDGNTLAASDAGSVARRVLLRRARGESDQVVDDDVDGAADGIGREVSEIQRFRPNALAGECRVAVHHNGPDFIQNFPRAIDLRAVHTVARQFRAGAAHGDGIHRFQVAGIRDEVNVERLSGGSRVGAGSAYVVFDVAGTEHAARIDVLKARDNLVHGLAGDVGHDVEPAAVAHGHDGIDAAEIASGVENGIEKRNKRGVAFQRETLAAGIAALEHLFKEIGANQAVENFRLIDLEFGAFHALGNPAAAVRLRDVQEFHADGAAIIAASFLRVFAGEAFEIGALEGGEEAERVERGFIKAPAAEKIEDALAFGVTNAVGRRGFLRGFGRLCRSDSHRVSHVLFYQASILP